MSLLDNFKESVKNHFDKRREEQERIRQIQLEVNTQKQLAFEDEYRKNLKEVLIAKAKKEAAQKSGLQKLRAENRLRNLQKQGEPSGSFFDKLREHTQRNLARTEERKRKNEEMQEIAKKNKEQKMIEIQKQREERMLRSKQRTPFSR